ncbi:type I glyceraldehyde-3-phosphate dehydrogenase [Patescibacteria group bacterium]|nr:type I glyceraldehyde-3-phosphate dehydrogenase [Patescibacteria group bacterium]
MAKPKCAINGFGRIGRMLLRANLLKDEVDIVAVNDPNPTESLAYLLKYDSAQGTLKNEVKVEGENIIVDGKAISCTHELDPKNLPWADHKIDVVFESTGIFCDKEKASRHIEAGAKYVIVTAPGKDLDGTFVRGVNCGSFNPAKQKIISNASCTTNCLAPIAKVLHENFGLVKGYMTTVHAYTNDQRILDLAHKDLRRGRAAAANIIPTSTGAAKAIGEVLPELNGRLDGCSLRVPVVDGSLVDLVCTLEKEASVKEINAAMKKASKEGSLHGILQYMEDPIVSSDVIGNPYSSIFDPSMTSTMGNMVKVMSWYDNEWGYSNRTLELAVMTK